MNGNASSASLVDVESFGSTNTAFDVVLVDGAGNTKQLGRDGGFVYNPVSNQFDVDGGGTLRNVTVGIVANNEINTTTGNLRLSSSGGNVNIIAQTNITGNASISGIATVTGNLITKGDNDLGNDTGDNTTVSGKLFVNHGQDSDSTSTGALRVTGGISCTESLYVDKKIRAGDDIIAFNSSDISLKENITPIPNSLDKILSLSGNIFSWNSKSDYNGTDDIGILAQEVEALGLPGITKTRENGDKAVRYDRLIPILIEAVKELTAKVKSLESNK